MSIRPCLIAPLLWALACAPVQPRSAPQNTQDRLQGTWRVELQSPGGPLPVTLRVQANRKAAILNGEEVAPFSSVQLEGDRAVLSMDWYDSRLEGQLTDGGRVLSGTWSKRTTKGRSKLPFVATKNDERRFIPSVLQPIEDAPESIDGRWRVQFKDSSTFPAIGEFRQRGTKVQGTFLTETGDYRYLEGSYESGHLRLSCLDGGHAFLFVARATSTGLQGDFWSRDSYHATWTATSMAPDETTDSVLRRPETLSQLVGERFEFSFEDLQGRLRTHDDPALRKKVVLIDLFGSWCPNCNDLAPVLARWHKKYRTRGLEVIGIAFEFTGDPQKDREVLRAYRAHHGIEFPLLLGGVSNKKKASEALKSLDRLIAYPTMVFVGRDGRVHKIHAGFFGPGTGPRYSALVESMEAEIEALLK